MINASINTKSRNTPHLVPSAIKKKFMSPDELYLK